MKPKLTPKPHFKSSPKTHFICLPLRSPSFRAKVVSFNALLPPTINHSIIRPPGSLHFTIGVMSLPNPEDVAAAVEFLRSCHSDALATVHGRNIRVKLKGIASIATNIKKTNVIYAVPEEGDGRLRLLCSKIPPPFH